MCVVCEVVIASKSVLIYIRIISIEYVCSNVDILESAVQVEGGSVPLKKNLALQCDMGLRSKPSKIDNN